LPYPSQRNKQPAFFGRSERVGVLGQGDSEIHYARKAVEAGIIRTGALYAHFRRFTPLWNEGFCPRCMSTFSEKNIDPDCYICYGTGFDGGYSRPVVQWMMIINLEPRTYRTQTGIIIDYRSDSQSPYIPHLATGDLLGRMIKRTPSGASGAWDVQERFVVSGHVRPVRVREISETTMRNTSDHLDPVPEIIGYRFEAVYLTPNEDIDKQSVEYQIPFKRPVWIADMNEVTR
jgi:hypothetical protein